jgi:hypothetical protein
MFLLSTLVGVFLWLLKNKDMAQAKEINELKIQVEALFRKHDADVAALQELRVVIASNHYERTELDRKFDKMEATFAAGFNSLGKKFDELAKTLVNHLIHEDSKKREH